MAGESEEKLRNAAMAANGEYKRRPRRAGRADDNLYRAARQAGLRGLANKFSITAAQLGEILSGTPQAVLPHLDSHVCGEIIAGLGDCR